jgi:hypothetical protein
MFDDAGWEMDLTAGERNRLKVEYTSQQLMEVVVQARDYFRDYLGGGTYKGRPVEIKLNSWGRLTRKEGVYTYEVCLAGLWYLMTYSMLLSGRWVKVDVPPIMLFLNALRFPSLAKDTIMEVLGVDISGYPPEDWGRIDNQYILTFLDWLVMQSTPGQ